MKSYRKVVIAAAVFCALVLSHPAANAEEAQNLEYHDPEVTVFIRPSQPVQIFFPYVVQGVWQKKSPVSVDIQGNYIIATPPKVVSELGPEGSLRAFYLLDKRRYVVRFRWAQGISPAPKVLRFVDSVSRPKAMQSANAIRGTDNAIK